MGAGSGLPTMEEAKLQRSSIKIRAQRGKRPACFGCGDACARRQCTGLLHRAAVLLPPKSPKITKFRRRFRRRWRQRRRRRPEHAYAATATPGQGARAPPPRTSATRPNRCAFALKQRIFDNPKVWLRPPFFPDLNLVYISI
jgi:hypothetical protein